MKIDRDVMKKLRRLEASDSKEWISLLKDIGEDPKTFFDNGIWVGVDFSMSDMSQIDFRDSIVEGCIFASANENKNNIHLNEKQPLSGVPPAMAFKSANEIGKVSLETVRQVNQIISDAVSFKEGFELLKIALHRRGPVSADTISRLWYKVDSLHQFDLLKKTINYYGINDDEGSITAVSKAKLRISARKKHLSHMQYRSHKIDKRRLSRAKKLLSAILKQKRD